MSIHFSNFAVEIRTTFSPPETRIIGKHMKETLKHILDSSLVKASIGLNEVLNDLKEGLGEERFKNEYYISLLKVSSFLDSEYFRREREKAGL